MPAAAATGDEPPASLAALVAPHIDSFDYFLTEGLQRVGDALQPCLVAHPASGAQLSVWLEALRVGKPVREESRATEAFREMRVFPRECRQAGTSYTAPLLARVCWQLGEGDTQSKEVRLSDMPVMVRSHVQGCSCIREHMPCRAVWSAELVLQQVRSMACNLHALNKQELREHGEEAIEFGGYFIVNGIERIIRLLINQRRHYIMGMVRGAYSRRGATFTEFATAIRCVSPDETSITVRTHYMTNGSARLAFVLRRQEFYIPARGFSLCAALLASYCSPVGLHRSALCSRRSSNAATARSLIRCGGVGSTALCQAAVLRPRHQIVDSAEQNAFAAERVEVLLRETTLLGVRTRAQCLAHLGKHFRAVRPRQPH